MDRSSLIHMKRQLNVTDLSGEKVMIDFETGKYFLIKGVGNDIWDMIQSDITVGDIISKLMEEYDVSEAECESSVMDFLNKLVEFQII
ncbi:MAG: lasso peptide biosynthesis PqqD family chaperone [Agathobacter sp.]|nr:lasso peptide biosynthesis PqqD family chaperone [Agathobacter sp.]MDY3795600.1 lasso peptide biosynthesis PqqD family chaperone [Agathobacter sp.]